ncbi:MAG: cupin domain-containing protein [Faecalibacterium sp.]|jgi:mannose-1-phosphate guanylyltransferase|nr:cupin domain-containing protein [Faecalibacterium sp.]
MNVVLLSGGSGKRLWPLSNDVRSKQFIKMFRNENGGYDSMVQRVYRQITRVDSEASVTIATSKKQVSAIKNQLGDKVSICVEPERRDTFPAIALAAAFLHDQKGVGEDEAIVVCPVDPYVDDSYFSALKSLCALAEAGTSNLTLMGIEPTYPSEKYGYILPEGTGEVSKVKTFKEKPDVETAKRYLAQGAVWNGGVFAFRLGYLLKCAHEQIHFTDYQDLFLHYGEQKKISFDYAVVEHEPNVQMMRYTGRWKDLGTWNTFAEAMDAPVIGNAVLNETCHNTNVINELNLPILCMGCKDMVIAASNDGILVSEKEQSSYIKPFVDQMEQQVMYAEKSWGSFTVLDIQDGSMTIKIVLQPGHRLNYHSHDHRDEVWTVMSGAGTAVLDGVEQAVKPGDVVRMAAACKHTVIAGKEGMQILEVQLGKEISVHDKHKYPFPR